MFVGDGGDDELAGPSTRAFVLRKRAGSLIDRRTVRPTFRGSPPGRCSLTSRHGGDVPRELQRYVRAIL
jgi:hypothetical protein